MNRKWLVIVLIFIGCVDLQSAEELSRTNLLQFTTADGVVQSVRSTNDWQFRRAAILRAMQDVMGPLPGAEKRVALDVRVVEVTDCGDYVRHSLTYAAEPGGRVPAYLLVPTHAMISHTTNRFPAVLALHQTHPLGQRVVVGLGQSTNDEYGVELVRRGYVVLAPAYPLLANYQPDVKALGYASGTMKAIWDNIRGLDLLDSLPYVRRGRFGAIGHSLGGHNAIYTAVFDERIRVVISSCGFDSYRDYKNGDITGWTSIRYMPRLKAYAPDRYPFDFHELLGALAPRAVYVNAPLGDSNFQWRSVDAVANSAREVFALHGVPQNLRIAHPDCGHLFPPDQRAASYRMLDAELQK